MICPSKPAWMINEGFLKYKYLSKNILNAKIIEFCRGCIRNMAAVPHGAFAAKKVRQNEEKRKEFYCAMELNPTNYSSKYMNSIWGQYNRYSVHNLKKIMDNGVSAFASSVSKEKKSFAATQSVEKPAISTDLGPVGSISFASNNVYN